MLYLLWIFKCTLRDFYQSNKVSVWDHQCLFLVVFVILVLRFALSRTFSSTGAHPSRGTECCSGTPVVWLALMGGFCGDVRTETVNCWPEQIQKHHFLTPASSKSPFWFLFLCWRQGSEGLRAFWVFYYFIFNWLKSVTLRCYCMKSVV